MPRGLRPEPARTPRLPKDPELLRLLLRRVEKVIEFLDADRQRQAHRLKILRKALREPRSILSQRAFLAEIAAESRTHLARGGPPATALAEYVDPQSFGSASRRFHAAQQALARVSKAASDAAGWCRCVAALEDLLEAQSAVMDVFHFLERRVIAALEDRADRADTKADKSEVKAVRLPQNVDVNELARLINKTVGAEGSKLAVARQFTDGDEKRAQNLLRQLRRFPHLLNHKQKRSR